MPALQELILKDPEMMIDRFSVEIPAGADWQRWYSEFLGGESVEVWYEAEQVWLPGVAASWFIEDGSGNAPGANAHFFWKFEREGKKYKLDMDGGQRIRMEAPTIEEMIARPKHCEDLRQYDTETRYNPARYGTCYEPVVRRVRGSWYCEKHAQRNEQMLAAIAGPANREE